METGKIAAEIEMKARVQAALAHTFAFGHQPVNLPSMAHPLQEKFLSAAPAPATLEYVKYGKR